MPLRRTLLYLARQPALRHWVETSAATRRLSQRFVAGATLDQAIAACLRLKQEGLTATLDYLGENVASPEQAAACRDIGLQTLQTMRASGLEPNISLKLTQFGLDLSTEACEQNVDALVTAAAGMNGFVRVDMESSQYTDRTLSIVQRIHARHPQCGTVIQSYLRRTAGDVATLTETQIRIRLCKGAYLEPATVAFPTKAEVDANYLALAERLLQTAPYPALATHDESIIHHIRAFVAQHQIPRDRFEFQMLYGIRRDLQRTLIAEGFRVRIYVPFGEAWYPYFMRRLAERPANLIFLLRNMFRS